MQGGPKIEEGQTVGVRSGLQRPYRDTRARRLRGGARRADEGRISNVDSGELQVQSARLKYY